MLKKSKFILFIILGAMTIMPLSLVSSCNHNNTIQIVMADFFNSWVATYAIREGIVTSNNIKVEIVFAQDFSAQLAAGKFPMGALDAAKFSLLNNESNKNFKALSTFIVHEGATAAKGVHALYTMADSGINSPADLIGKKVGIDDSNISCTANVFLGFLQEEYGIKESQFEQIYNPSAALLGQLRAGNLDAVMLAGNASPQAANDPTIKRIWNLDEAFYNKYGVVFYPSVLVVEEKYYAKNKAIVAEVFDMLVESNKYGSENISVISEKYAAYRPGLSPEFYQTVFNNNSSCRILPLVGKERDSIIRLWEIVQYRGIITELPDPESAFVIW